MLTPLAPCYCPQNPLAACYPPLATCYTPLAVCYLYIPLHDTTTAQRPLLSAAFAHPTPPPWGTFLPYFIAGDESTQSPAPAPAPARYLLPLASPPAACGGRCRHMLPSP